MAENILSELLEAHDFLSKRESLDHPAVNCPAERLLELLAELRDRHGLDMLTDITAIDWHEQSPRFTVVYHLFSTEGHSYFRVACDCGDDEEPVIPSVSSLWPGANWHERETYDMFGIKFEGHPDLRRILMWEDYPYFPLRKDFPLAGKDVDLPGADVAEETGARVIAAPMMGGPFHASPGKPMSEGEPRAKDESWTEEKEKP